MTVLDALFMGILLAGAYFVVGAAVYITSIDGYPPVSRDRAFCRAVLWPCHIIIGWPK